MTQVCPQLAEMIEAGRGNTPDTQILLQAWIEPLLAQGCDALVLGCTHYAFIRTQLEAWLP